MNYAYVLLLITYHYYCSFLKLYSKYLDSGYRDKRRLIFCLSYCCSYKRPSTHLQLPWIRVCATHKCVSLSLVMEAFCITTHSIAFNIRYFLRNFSNSSIFYFQRVNKILIFTEQHSRYILEIYANNRKIL